MKKSRRDSLNRSDVEPNPGDTLELEDFKKQVRALYWFVEQDAETSGHTSTNKKNKKAAKKLAADIGELTQVPEYNPKKYPDDKIREKLNRQNIKLLKLATRQFNSSWARWRDLSIELSRHPKPANMTVALALVIVVSLIGISISLGPAFYDLFVRKAVQASNKAMVVSFVIGALLSLCVVFHMVIASMLPERRWTNRLIFFIGLLLALSLFLLRLAIVETGGGLLAALGWALLEASCLMLVKVTCLGVQKVFEDYRLNLLLKSKAEKARLIHEDRRDFMEEKIREVENHGKFIFTRNQLARLGPRLKDALIAWASYAHQTGTNKNRNWLVGWGLPEKGENTSHQSEESSVGMFESFSSREYRRK